MSLAPRLPKLLLTITLLAGVFRAGYLWSLHQHPSLERPLLDARIYDEWARQVAAGDLAGKGAFFMSPGYPYSLGFLYAVLGAGAPRAGFHRLAIVLQLAAGAVACAALASVAARLYGPLAGWTTGLLAASYAPSLFYEGLLLTTGPINICLAFVLWAMVGGRASLAGALLGYAGLLRPSVLAFAPLAAFWFAVDRRFASFPLRFILAVLIVLLPLLLRNRMVTGRWELAVADAGIVMYIGNNSDATGTNVTPAFARMSPETQLPDFTAEAARRLGTEARHLAPADVSRFWMREAVTWAWSHPVDWSKLLWRKARLFWHTYEVPSNFSYEFQKSEVAFLRLPLIGFGFIAPLGLLGLAVSVRRADTWPLHLLAGSVFGVNLMFCTLSEYRFAVVPALLVAAGGALAWLVTAVRRRPGHALAGLAGLAVAAGLVHGHAPLPRRDFAHPHLSLGMADFREGRYDTAIQEFTEAIRIRPAFPEAYLNRGTAQAKSGRFAEAAEDFRRALALRPGYADAAANLAAIEALRKK